MRKGKSMWPAIDCENEMRPKGVWEECMTFRIVEWSVFFSSWQRVKLRSRLTVVGSFGKCRSLKLRLDLNFMIA